MGKIKIHLSLLICFFLVSCSSSEKPKNTGKPEQSSERYCLIATQAYSISGNRIFNESGLYYEAKSPIIQASWDSSSNCLVVLCPLTLDIVSSLEKKLKKSIPAQGIYQKMKVRKGKLLVYSQNGSANLQLIDLLENATQKNNLTHSNPFNDFDINHQFISVLQADELLLFTHDFHLIDKKKIQNGKVLAMDNTYLAAIHSGKIWQYNLINSNLKEEIAYEN